MSKKIIVLTPVKNEGWILDSFLKITSSFSDLIIIYDDNSQDHSRDICRKYDKVYLIEGKEKVYNELKRQEILINKARELINDEKIFLAIDADELLTYNSINSDEWKIIRSAEQGTVLCFEKPDLIYEYSKCFRHTNTFCLGYIDDGKEHSGKIVHSTRVPVYPDSVKLFFKDIKLMHLALIRFDAYLARQRFYKVVENINQTKSLYDRYRYYNGGVKSILGSVPVLTPEEWYKPWVINNILPEKFAKEDYYWYDLEIIKYINEHGSERFWKDDIWEFDYNNELIDNSSLKKDLNMISINYPPPTDILIIKFFRLLLGFELILRKLLRK